MSDIKLTVILLTYNHEGTVAKSIESVLEQETTHGYKIWICEDCSTDGTLRICREYADKYPDRVTLIAQPVNSGLMHLKAALSKIGTPYFTILEGDDYWCDSGKIQTAIDIFENNPQYVTVAHDTLFNNSIDNTRLSLVHQIHKTKIENPVQLESALLLHSSSRIYRNVIDFQKFPANMILYDFHLFYLFLDKGSLFYSDKIMSVYNITGTGIWSRLTEKRQKRQREIALYEINELLEYRHDAFFSSRLIKPEMQKRLKRVFGMRIGWKLYFCLRYGKICVVNRDRL
jgi:glycosyltransferase involved in cell wall biosynthesis